MEQSPSQKMRQGMHRAPVNPASLPPEYWNSLNLFTDPQSQHSHPSQQHSPQQQAQQLQQQPQQQQPSQQQQPPLGIGWDHPALHHQQAQPQRSPLPTQREQTHGMYSSSTPQSWQQNPLHHQPIVSSTPQGIGMPAQYRQVPQYAQGQMTYDSRPLGAPDSAHYQSLSFTPNFYTPPHVTPPEAFPQSLAPQPQLQSQTPSYHPELHRNSVPQYPLSAGFSDDNSHASINFANDFAPAGVSEHTINPQFLGSQQQASQNASLQNPFPYVNLADETKWSEYFPDDLQIQSILGQPVVSNAVAPNQSSGVDVAPMNGQYTFMSTIPAPSAELRARQPGAKKVSQTKKVPAKTSSKKPNGKISASSSSASDTDGSDLEIQYPEEPSPIPPTRPTDLEAAAQYDTLKAVWFPRNRRPNVDRVKTALVAFKDVVKNVRDTWKENTQALKTAENKGEDNETTQLRKQVALQRRLMDVVVSTTLDKGHPVIVEKLGEHPMAVAALYSFLLDRHQASDIDGALTVNILKLLARFVTMDEDVLLKTNVAKLLPRFVKKGGKVVKDLAQNILDNATASTKRKQENGKPAPKEGSPGRNSFSDVLAVEVARNETPGSKRPRDGESNGQPATKRVVVTSNIKGASKPTNPSAINGPAKRPQETGQESKATPVNTSNAARPKANIVAPKPTNLFGSLNSASKRPGTSNAERAAAAAAAAAKISAPGEKKEAQPVPSRPAFSFGDIMADLNKQKETAPRDKPEDKAPETEDERQKRLRKEARRKLRVKWKPDDALTEVRLFTHDPDEELGPSDRSHEAGDVKGEGSVLKLHRDLDELDEDEEGGIREEQLLDYREPSEIDDAEISPDDRARNYIKRIGVQQPTSAEAKAQEHREATTLMVFYTSPADVPPSAKEPPPPSADEIVPDVLSFGEIPDHVKARQERYYSMINPQQPPPAQPGAQNNQFVSNLLKIIQNAPPQQQSTPPPAQTQPAQAPLSDLERTINMFRQQQQASQPQPQPQPQPQIQPQPQSLQMPQFPVVSQPSQAQGFDYQKLLAVVNAQQQMQQQQQQQQQQPQPSAMPPNLAAIISQLTNQNQQASTNPSQTSNHYEDPERKRMREYGGYDGHEDDRYSGYKRNKLNVPNKKHPKAGLVPCRYWREGKCLKGEDCTFRHDPL